MNNKRFLVGMGLGMAAGGAIGMMVSPRRHTVGKHMVSRALRGMGDVIDDVTAVLGK